MITTVTTVTLAIVSTVQAGSLAGIAVVALLFLLVNKEMLVKNADPRAERFKQALNVAVAPLLIVFVMVTLLRILGAMQ